VSREIDIVVEAAFQTTMQVGTADCHELITYALNLAGREIASQLVPTDEPVLFVPVKFAFGGREANGCVLALRDKAVLSWWTGWLNIETRTAVVPYDTITDIRLDTHLGSIITGPRRMIDLRARERWTIILPAVFGAFPMPGLLAATFTGAVSLSGGEDQRRAEAQARRRRERADLLLLA
jgi:hypothetical protein